ncbi:MAG: AFG1 family ATPase [Alphaproteobacteria bacterium]|nr:AFG1 family ATPase [Alphaproteobacteria bacterium]MBL7098842.1 AFG1 family ATPase [Alphaproteobacteria bacterium]
MTLLGRYRAAIARGELKDDAAQAGAAARLAALSEALGSYKPGRRLFFGQRTPPRGLYIWGDVGRGKSMLMDLFFEGAPMAQKERIHFNEFMVDTHARIHEERQKAGTADPIAPVGREIAERATLLCFDEFQVTDIADAMILGRLFEQLFERGVVIVATSNTPPDRLYEGGLNRQLFLPFIAEIEQRLEVVELDGPVDYRLHRISGLNVYLHPLGPATDAAMNAAWLKLTDRAEGAPATLTVLGRSVRVPQAARGVARFSFDDLCAKPLAGADYLAIAHAFHTVLLDRIPKLTADQRNEARRFVLLIDTLYDEGVKLICSAAAPPEELYAVGDGAESFRRTVSRLHEMQSEDYLKRGHGTH